MMDDMRHESRQDDRNRMIETIMECEGVDAAEAESLLAEAERECMPPDAADVSRAVRH